MGRHAPLANFVPVVAALLREVGRTIVMPRFGALRSGEIVEKTPGEIVTVADREAERAIAAGLGRLAIEARIVGEEACATDPGLLDGIGEGRLWLVDPVDGTANFAAGRGPFGLMVALIEDGAPVAAWLHDPLHDRMCTAVLGEGAHIDDAPFRVVRPERARPIASLALQFLSPAWRDEMERRAARALDAVAIPRCAAEHYPRVALGENDVAFFQRTLPWDHAAGALFLQEAGGVARRWDGSPYRVGDGASGLLAANGPEPWRAAHDVLFADGWPPAFGAEAAI